MYCILCSIIYYHVKESCQFCHIFEIINYHFCGSQPAFSYLLFCIQYNRYHCRGWGGVRIWHIIAKLLDRFCRCSRNASDKHFWQFASNIKISNVCLSVDFADSFKILCRSCQILKPWCQSVFKVNENICTEELTVEEHPWRFPVFIGVWGAFAFVSTDFGSQIERVG